MTRRGPTDQQSTERDRGNATAATALSLSRATQINALHEAVEAAASSALERAREAGELLLAEKKEHPYGTGLPWLETHCPRVSERVAQLYMQIARGWGQLLKYETRFAFAAAPGSAPVGGTRCHADAHAAHARTRR